MNKYLVRLICAFIPVKHLRKKTNLFLRKKYKTKIKGHEGNKILLPLEAFDGELDIFISGSDNIVEFRSLSGVSGKVFIKIQGNGNRIFFDEGLLLLGEGVIRVSVDGCGSSFAAGKSFVVEKSDLAESSVVSVAVRGNNHVCQIGNEVRCCILSAAIVAKCDGGIFIGNLTTLGGVQVVVHRSGTNVRIGESCMFSVGILLYDTDGHPVYDVLTKRMLNAEKGDLIIGDHCWIGMNAKILKKVVLEHDTIVGMNSVVTKSFSEPNIAVAGNPAKKIKEGVTWQASDDAYD